MRSNTRSNIAMKDFGERGMKTPLAAPVARQSAAIFGTVKTVDAATRALIDEAVARKNGTDKNGTDKGGAKA